jgi:hypothetical protein
MKVAAVSMAMTASAKPLSIRDSMAVSFYGRRNLFGAAKKL